jgi:hypothetical protein
MHVTENGLMGRERKFLLSLSHKTAKFRKEKEPCIWSVINPLIRQILSSISADVIVLRSKRNNFSDTKPNELPMIASDAETGLELVLQKSALDSNTHNRVFRFDQWRVKEEDNLELLQRGHTHTPNPKCLFLGSLILVSFSCSKWVFWILYGLSIHEESGFKDAWFQK